MYASFLSDLIDALDELEPETRTLLLADFEDDTVDPRVLIDGIWGSEACLENQDWKRCLHVFDKVIEKQSLGIILILLQQQREVKQRSMMNT